MELSYFGSSSFLYYLLQWLDRIKNGINDSNVTVFAVTCWILWRSRNKEVFNDNKWNVWHILRQIHPSSFGRFVRFSCSSIYWLMQWALLILGFSLLPLLLLFVFSFQSDKKKNFVIRFSEYHQNFHILKFSLVFLLSFNIILSISSIFYLTPSFLVHLKISKQVESDFMLEQTKLVTFWIMVRGTISQDLKENTKT